MLAACIRVGHVCCVAVGAWQAAALHVPRVVAPPALNFLLHGVCIDVAAASAMSAALPRCATAALRLYLLLCSVCDAPTHAWIRRSASRLMVKPWVDALTLVVAAVVASFTPACASLYSMPSQSNSITPYLPSAAHLPRLRCVPNPTPKHQARAARPPLLFRPRASVLLEWQALSDEPFASAPWPGPGGGPGPARRRPTRTSRSA